MASKDWESLRDQIETAVRDQLAGLTNGTIEELQGPVREAANRLVVAIRRGPAGQKLVDEIRDELALRLLEKEIEARDAYSKVFDIILGTGLNLLFSGAIAGLSSIKTG